MFSINNLVKNKGNILFGILSCVLLACMTATIICLILAYQGCEDVKSCTYSIGNIESPDCIVFYYEYVINNRTGCRMWCQNPMDWASCPMDGSSCDVTHFVRDYCKYNGFADFFDCGDNVYYTISMMFGLVTVVIAISSLFILCSWKKDYNEETVPLNVNS